VRVGRGNHEAFADGLVPLRGWYPIEILHFPVRSLEHCMRKYVTQFVALEKNAEKGIPGHMADAYRAYRARGLEQFYAPLVVDDEQLESGLATGELAVDTRLRDALRSLGFGDAETGPREAPLPLAFGRPSITEVAHYAAESSALQESDLGLALGARVEDLEARVRELHRGTVARIRTVVGRNRRS